jgi:hypothetical protein
LTTWVFGTANNFKFVFNKNKIQYKESGDFHGVKFIEVQDVYDALDANNIDGLMYRNIYEGSGFSYSVFFPNQIKLADGTNATFDGSNPDIRYNDGGLTASNGKKSNLTPEQYKLVRTKAFKDWFGDWENDPANASKVVDENGEPMVVYHRSPKKFTIFDKDKIGNSYWKTAKFGFYFSNKNEKGLYGNKVYKCFLNLREPYDIEVPTLDHFDWRYADFDPFLWEVNRNDGLYIKINEVVKNKSDKHYVVFEPNQIKLADGSNATFDGSNPDIRFNNGGYINQAQSDLDAKYKLLIETFRSKGYDITEGDNSKTNFGHSRYFYVNFENRLSDNFDKGLKARVSDHSVGNTYRLLNEFHFGNSKNINSLEKENVAIIEYYLRPEKFTIVPHKTEWEEEYVVGGNEVKPTDVIIESLGKSNRGLEKFRIKRKKYAVTTYIEDKETKKQYRYENGGEMKSVSNGTITVGASHEEGGIPVYNKGTGQMLEVEGGEGIINKRSMALKKKVTLNGDKMTPCEAASEINQMAGGVAYNCDNAKSSKETYDDGGEFKKGLDAEQEHIQTLNRLYYQDIAPNEAIDDIVEEHLSEDDKYYSKLRGIMAEQEKPKTTKEFLREIEPYRHKHECWCGTNKYDNGGETDKDLSDIELPKNLDDYDILGEKGIYEKKPTIELSEQDKINSAKLGNAIKKMQELINTDYKPIILADQESMKLHRYVEKVRHLNLYKLGWRANVGMSKAWAGICMSGGKKEKREIMLSYNFIVGDNAFEENLEDVMLHEIAHAIVAELFIMNPFELPLDKLKPSRIKDLGLYKQPIDIIDQTHSESGGHGIMWAAVCEAISKGYICDMFYRLAEANELMEDYKYKCIRCSNEEYGSSSRFATKCSKCNTPVLVIKNKL